MRPSATFLIAGVQHGAELLLTSAYICAYIRFLRESSKRDYPKVDRIQQRPIRTLSSCVGGEVVAWGLSAGPEFASYWRPHATCGRKYNEIGQPFVMWLTALVICDVEATASANADACFVPCTQTLMPAVSSSICTLYTDRACLHKEDSCFSASTYLNTGLLSRILIVNIIQFFSGRGNSNFCHARGRLERVGCPKAP